MDYSSVYPYVCHLTTVGYFIPSLTPRQIVRGGGGGKERNGADIDCLYMRMVRGISSN